MDCLTALAALNTLASAYGITGAACPAPPPPPSPPPPPAASHVPVSVWFQPASVSTQAKAVGIDFLMGLDLGGRPHVEAADLAPIKAAGIKVAPFITGAADIPAIKALDGAETVTGYVLGDEPNCSVAPGLPATVAAIKVADNLPVYSNFTAWVTAPLWSGCPSDLTRALQSVAAASADAYPPTSPYAANPSMPVSERSDFVTKPNDVMWYQGLMVAGLKHFAAPGQPVWAFVEAGADNFGQSLTGNPLQASITANVVTNLSGWSKFTPAWLGLSIAGRQITGIIDATHATVANGPDVPAGGVAVTGGVRNSDCVGNLCLVNGNEYRATPADVKAEVWASIINGATGIEWFCHDSTDYAFCLKDPVASKTVAQIDADVQSFAPMILSPTLGMCSMQREDYIKQVLSTSGSCADGILTMASTGIPGMAMVKSYGGATYLFAQSDRRGAATFTFTLTGLAGKTVTPIYGGQAAGLTSNRALTLDASGTFSDAFTGDYQTKIYRVQ